MTNEERNLNPESENPLSEFDHSDDDLRYAPPANPVQFIAETGDEVEGDAAEVVDHIAIDDTLILSDEDQRFAPIASASSISESSVELAGDSLPVPVTDGLDIEAALAAVSTLSDVVAEQEAVEQARIARIEAEAQAKAERQARLENPERYFPVPPLSTLKRGQLASIIPAVWLIGIGAWLTFSGTSLRVLPDTNLLITVILVGIGLTLLSRWMSSRRWARGSLFFGLLFIGEGALYYYLLQPGSFGLERGWPLFIAVIGLAMLLTHLFAVPRDLRLALPAFILLIVGIAGSLITLNLLPTDITFFAASVWPIAIVIIVLIWLLPLVFRQRQ